MNKIIKKEGYNEGFTIVELVISLAIIIIILSIAVPNFMKYTEKARETADKASARIIALAAEMAIIDEKLDKITLSDLKSKGYLDTIPIPQVKDKKAFVIKLDNSRITVSYDGGIVLYPGIDNATD